MSLKYYEDLRNAKVLELEAIDHEIIRLKAILPPTLEIIEHLPAPVNENPENGKIYKIYCEDNPSLVISIGHLISNHARKTRSIICEPISDSKTQEWKCISKNNHLSFINNAYPNMCLDKFYGTGGDSDKRMVLYEKNNTKAQMFTYSLESGLIKTCNGYLSIINNQVFSTPSSTQKFIFKCVIVQPPSA
jgi:hypothetical protein